MSQTPGQRLLALASGNPFEHDLHFSRRPCRTFNQLDRVPFGVDADNVKCAAGTPEIGADLPVAMGCDFEEKLVRQRKKCCPCHCDEVQDVTECCADRKILRCFLLPRANGQPIMCEVACANAVITAQTGGQFGGKSSWMRFCMKETLQMKSASTERRAVKGRKSSVVPQKSSKGCNEVIKPCAAPPCLFAPRRCGKEGALLSCFVQRYREI